jgi:hypothetical protein
VCPLSHSPPPPLPLILHTLSPSLYPPPKEGLRPSGRKEERTVKKVRKVRKERRKEGRSGRKEGRKEITLPAAFTTSPTLTFRGKEGRNEEGRREGRQAGRQAGRQEMLGMEGRKDAKEGRTPRKKGRIPRKTGREEEGKTDSKAGRQEGR